MKTSMCCCWCLKKILSSQLAHLRFYTPPALVASERGCHACSHSSKLIQPITPSYNIVLQLFQMFLDTLGIFRSLPVFPTKSFWENHGRPRFKDPVRLGSRLTLILEGIHSDIGDRLKISLNLHLNNKFTYYIYICSFFKWDCCRTGIHLYFCSSLVVFHLLWPVVWQFCCQKDWCRTTKWANTAPILKLRPAWISNMFLQCFPLPPFWSLFSIAPLLVSIDSIDFDGGLLYQQSCSGYSQLEEMTNLPVEVPLYLNPLRQTDFSSATCKWSKPFGSLQRWCIGHRVTCTNLIWKNYSKSHASMGNPHLLILHECRC